VYYGQVNPMRAFVAICLLACAATTAGAQEIRYITDILQLGLHRAEDTSDSPFENLVSGTEVTVLERVPNFARVRTADGEEGWVKSAFLVSEKPAQLRVAELEQNAAELEHALAEAIATRDSAGADAAALIASAELDLAAAKAARDTLARLQIENADFEERMELYRGALPWPWVVGALVVVLAGGFAAGWWWLDASIRRRHGGFRVY
jgi:SH3 domain protein